MSHSNNLDLIQKIVQRNVDLIEILVDPGACGLCQSKAGRYSISGQNKDYPKLTNNDIPPYHPNCNCKIQATLNNYSLVQGVSNRSPYCSNERSNICNDKLYFKYDNAVKNGDKELKNNKIIEALEFYYKALDILKWITECSLPQNEYCSNINWAKIFYNQLINKINQTGRRR